MRRTRVIYIENDPALREILARLLEREEGIEVVATVGSAQEALQYEGIRHIDAALIDYSLGSDSLNGLELGIALRAFNEHLGILIYSQFDIHNLSKRIPVSMQHGWGFATKSGTADIGELAKLLTNVAQGHNISQETSTESGRETTENYLRYGKLSERQRATMKLASQGYSPKTIAEKLGMTYDMARQELSRAYKILIPNVDDEKTLSVAAILEFNKLRRDLEGNREDPF